ncbi:hypothetical protein DPX16_22198 [Anabarilius grahami]|uniref:Uncharacterized protein n=1 Tax=Anabarilius grahami TaxID=495550 RepID=A0A3N0XNM7_ANAGA|nr:hypothetical protein DPX16_22198 [Anabarilius grahami]
MSGTVTLLVMSASFFNPSFALSSHFDSGLQGITAVEGLMALSVWLREFARRHTHCRLQ